MESPTRTTVGNSGFAPAGGAWAGTRDTPTRIAATVRHPRRNMPSPFGLRHVRGFQPGQLVGEERPVVDLVLDQVEQHTADGLLALAAVEALLLEDALR